MTTMGSMPIDTTSRTWHVTAGDRSCTGSASTAAAAWNNAAIAALQLARDTDGAVALQISVTGEGEPADVEPARTVDGALDSDATRAVLARFVELVLTSHSEEA